jgi:polyisoprenyl-teichoic acid--peptidoglycan teichoic acid transferase
MINAPAKRKPMWRRVLSAIFYGLVCAFSLAAGTVYGWIGRSPILADLVRSRFSALPLVPAPQDPFENQQSLTVLVLGCDADLSWGGGRVIKKHARSDMMLVAKLDFANNRITGLSIPRDTLVAVPGYRKQKINGYHAMGGVDLAKQAVEQIMPVAIDRVIVLDFDAFQRMVDAAGGVDVYVPKKMKYTDKVAKLYIDLKPGRQHLDGYQAMGFIRFRHSDNDLMRVERQRDFVLSLKEAVMSNPLRLPEIANQAVDVMGGALSTPELVSLANFAQKVGSDNIKLSTIPVVDAPNKVDLLVDERRLPEVLKQFHFAEDFEGHVTYR